MCQQQQALPGLPLQQIPLGHCTVQGGVDTMQYPRDDFGDSPRDHVLANLDGGTGGCPWTSAEVLPLPSLLSAPRASPGRSRKSGKKGRQQGAAARGDERNASNKAAAAMGPEPAAPREAGGAEATASAPATAEPEAWPEGATTVMLRNIPNRYTAEELLAEMLAVGFEGRFDFFYLPIDFTTKRNRGYSFINFRSPSDAERFVSAFHRQKLTRYATQKILEVSPAITQGFEANIAQFVKKDAQRIQNPWFRPMIFGPEGEGGMPAPTAR